MHSKSLIGIKIPTVNYVKRNLKIKLNWKNTNEFFLHKNLISLEFNYLLIHAITFECYSWCSSPINFWAVKKRKGCLKLIRPVHPAASTDSTDSYIENETSPWSCFFTFTREKRSYHKSHLLNVYVMGAFFSPPRSNHSKLLDWVSQYFSEQNSDGFVTLSFVL